jgi:hypothetical protein
MEKNCLKMFAINLRQVVSVSNVWLEVYKNQKIILLSLPKTKSLKSSIRALLTETGTGERKTTSILPAVSSSSPGILAHTAWML